MILELIKKTVNGDLSGFCCSFKFANKNNISFALLSGNWIEFIKAEQENFKLKLK